MENKGVRILIVVLIILILATGGILAYKIIQDKSAQQITSEGIENEKTEGNNVLTAVVEEKEVQIYKGNDRPIAVMIDNHTDAWPQAGLNKAYMVYEIVVEGGETRLMALFKGVDIEKIGPVRSARHYFLDYAMENDAIYVHFGWSPQAQSDITKYSIHNINGISEDGVTFWRVKDKYAPHNAVTSTEKILESAKNKNYRTTSTKESVLNYVAEEIELQEQSETKNTGTIENINSENMKSENVQSLETVNNINDDITQTNTSNTLNGTNNQEEIEVEQEQQVKDAIKVTIPHSTLQIVEYNYDEQTKTYKRIARNKEQTDWDTQEPITTKNIIITFCDNYTLTDTENKGRQGLRNIGTFDGYYITNGKAMKIKCTKTDRDEQTKYTDLEGNEIKVNDGNTWVNICPTNAKVVIEGGE